MLEVIYLIENICPGTRILCFPYLNDPVINRFLIRLPCAHSLVYHEFLNKNAKHLQNSDFVKKYLHKNVRDKTICYGLDYLGGRFGGILTKASFYLCASERFVA